MSQEDKKEPMSSASVNSEANRDALVEKYLWLVRHVASSLARQITNVNFDDLVGDGVFGLMKAIAHFDSTRGVKFETYAVPVVRGAMLNGLRAMDWVSERDRTKSREIQKAMDRFQQTHGRSGSEIELAQELQVSAKEVYQMIATLNSSYLLSLDQPASVNLEDERTILDTLQDTSTREPETEYRFQEERKLLVKAIEELPERENLLITRYYLEGKNFEVIAEELSISKQRVSQLHAKAIEKLRKTLRVGSDEVIGTLLEGAFFS